MLPNSTYYESEKSMSKYVDFEILVTTVFEKLQLAFSQKTIFMNQVK